MLDYRIITFLKLCDTMNYRITAEELNMTQPAVTQHIKFLEQGYGCKLFNYNSKKLEKTEKCKILESYSRSSYYNDIKLRQELSETTTINIRIGATKTIGEFVINDKLKNLIKDKEYTFSLVVDNTEELLKLLEDNKLDFALIEGYFPKKKFESLLFKEEEFVGICGKEHRFAGKKINILNLFQEVLIVRERGSGTRGILEQILQTKNFSLESFKERISINNFRLIKDLVSSNTGISFVYKTVITPSDNISIFKLEEKISREFNYVFLKNTEAKTYVDIFNKL